jgi:hypothetical protein
VASLKKKKNELSIENFFEANSLDELSKKQPSGKAVFLVINNDHVLSKQIESAQNENLHLVNQAFPNLQIEEFYYEILSQEQNHFISVCRKKYVDEAVEQLKSSHLFVYGISLGNNMASSLIQFTDNEITTSNAQLLFEGKKLSNITGGESPIDKTYDINSLSVANNHILAFSGALNLILGQYHPKSNLEGKEQVAQNEYKHSRFFKVFSKAALVFILVVLLINFFFFNKYYQAVNELRQTTQINRAAKENFSQLSKEVEKKQDMVSDILRSNSSKSSFYANNIVQSLPSSILLSELNFQPLSKTIKEDEPIENSINTLIVAGKSANSKLFSEWITGLEAKSWVRKVEIMDYADVSKTSSTFEIKIMLSNGQEE